MLETARAALDLTLRARNAGPDPLGPVSRMAGGLPGSDILRVANEIRALAGARQHLPRRAKALGARS
jgi:hypothetical protein